MSSFTKLNVSGSSSTRKVIPVNLPYNTVNWFYSVSTCREGEDIESVQKRFNLFSEISKSVDRTGITSAILSRIGEPPGNNYVDVYLLASKSDKDIFINKYSNLTSSFSYIENDSRTQIISGKVPVISSGYMTGLQYLGIRNTDPTHGIAVCIQVVAIVEEPEHQSSYSSYNETQSGNDENSAGQEYNHMNNLISTIEYTDNSTNTTTTTNKEVNYDNLPSPKNGWDVKDISMIASNYGDILIRSMQEHKLSAPPNFIIRSANCMAAYTIEEYQFSDFRLLEVADRNKIMNKSLDYCASIMNK